ncbi:MAG: fatty acid CoA ligase family protein [Opitutales bacterium]
MLSHNVARHLLNAAQARPEQAGLIVPGNSEGQKVIRFDRLERLTAGAAARMSARGIKRGMRVSLLVKPGPSLILAVFALFRIGAVPVVIDPGMPRNKFLACLERSEPEALVGIDLAVWLSRLPLNAFRSLRVRVAVNRAFMHDVEAAATSPTDGPAETASDELAAILFTSGSTGPAKGVRYHHGAFNAQVAAIREAFAMEPGEVDLPMLPVFTLFNPALGITTVVPPIDPSRPARADPAKVFATLQEHGVTTSFGSPALWARLVDWCEAEGKTLPRLRRVLMAGAPSPFRLLERLQTVLPNARIHTPYGATEVLPVSSIEANEVLAETAAATRQGAGTCVGRPLPSVDARIVAASRTEGPAGASAAAVDLPAALPVGERGEIVVTGPTVTYAYDRLHEATARAKYYEITPDGTRRTWHRMGDAGYVDAQGRLWFLGRLAERVNTRHGPVDTEPVEGIVNGVDGIRRSALIAMAPSAYEVGLAVEVERSKRPDGEQREAVFATEIFPRLEAMWPQLGPLLYGLPCPVMLVPGMPVDVRHNAKIHRITLAKNLANAHSDRFILGREAEAQSRASRED